MDRMFAHTCYVLFQEILIVYRSKPIADNDVKWKWQEHLNEVTGTFSTAAASYIDEHKINEFQ